MSYFFADNPTQISYTNNCIKLTDIQNGGGSVVENKDGTVSVYMPSGPIYLSKVCCETLKPNSGYYFDLNSQKCRWTVSSDSCGLENIKVTLNPDGNDGTIFYTDSTDEVCNLNIEFDYLFKVSCESLTAILNGSDKTKQQLDIEKTVRDIQIQITKKTADCETISKQIIELNKQIEATSYSIECTQTFAGQQQQQSSSWSGINNFGNSAFSPFGFPISDSSAILCLTDDGLSFWQSILSTDNYNKFINGDPTSYTCDDVNTIKTQNQEIVKNNIINNINTPELFFQCTTPFGTKTQLLKDLDVLETNQTTCQSELTSLNTRLTLQQNNLNQLEPLDCANPIDTFETLNISVSLEVEDSFDNTRTIATYPLLSPIGVGNLYKHLTDNGDNSGFLVCGESNSEELAKGITGCTPMYLNDANNVFACGDLLEHMLDELYNESELTNKKELLKTLNNNVFASKFLHHNTVIDDQTIISQIINKKVKLSVRINHSCSDFCVLMDNIQLNKSCSLVTAKKMFIAHPPSFDLERVIDNKKSWVANTSFVNRTFNIRNEVNTNPIRLTDYDVNDDRLVINTKEIDLGIEIASGIETDVWCYITDNPCLLTALTQTNNCDCVTLPCFKDSFKIIDFEDSNFTNLSTIQTSLRASRDAWLKAINERDLAVGPNYSIKDSPYSVFVNPNLSIDREATNTAYNKANVELSIAQGAYIYGVTDKPNPNQSIDKPLSAILKCACGDVMMFKSGLFYIYYVSNNDNELEIYVQDNSGFYEPSTTLASLNNYITKGNPSGIKGYNGTPQLFCSVFGDIANHISGIQLLYNEYSVNDNVTIKGTGNSYDYRDLFTIQWDSTKGKCITKNKKTLPDAFGIIGLNQNCQRWCKRYDSSYYSPPSTDYETCVAQCSGDITYQNGVQLNLITTVTGNTAYINGTNHIISGITDTSAITVGDYVYGDGITWGSSVVSKTINTLEINGICTLTLDDVTIDVWDGRLGDKYVDMAYNYRKFRDFSLKLANEFALGQKRVYLTAVEDINGNIPEEPYITSHGGNLFIPIDVTSTFRKGAVDGPIVYQESYRLNDPSSTQAMNRPTQYGLGVLKLPIGSQDPNGFLNNTNPNASDYFGPIAVGTYITGSTAGMPFYNSGDNTIDAIDYNDNYYVHLDIIDTSGNTYYASNNDFNLKDISYLRKFPTTDSTQTFNINDVLNNIEEKKQEFIGARDYMLNLITKNGHYINDI
jgi:hypothetical protein